MNIRCPNCQSLFRVDPTRVPSQGVRARCSRCSAAFMITPEGAATGARTAAPVPAREASGPAAPPGAATPAPESQRAAAAPASPPPSPVFGSRDPHARAQRIARALVSDIVAYHPRRREEALGTGTMRTEFREEIMKSWEEYVAQVGSELAKSTPYFRNALNEILAGGQRVF